MTLDEKPSLDLESSGLIAKAMVQLKLAMGNIKDQKEVFVEVEVIFIKSLDCLVLYIWEGFHPLGSLAEILAR